MTSTTTQTQRWNNGRDHWRPAGEIFDPKRYGVEVIREDRIAKSFVERHHYSGSFPAARVRVGLFEMTGYTAPELVGVAVFSVPMNAHTVPKYFGLAANEGVELGRFILLDTVKANGETWFLKRAFEALQSEKPEVRGVVSYSDPVPRSAEGGRVVCPGHVGIIYQAFNGRYHGRAKSETLVRTKDWRVISRRSLSKIRNDERGAAGVYDLLLSLGAPRREAFESGAAYVERAIASGPFVKQRHPGNHVYTWSLSRKVIPLLPTKPYPKLRDAA